MELSQGDLDTAEIERAVAHSPEKRAEWFEKWGHALLLHSGAQMRELSELQRHYPEFPGCENCNAELAPDIRKIAEEVGGDMGKRLNEIAEQIDP